MLSANNPARRNRRGAIMISVLAFVVILSLLLAGALGLSASYYARAATEMNYTTSLQAAESGINYEIQKISNDSTQADQVSTGHASGNTYTTPAGTFTVYCAQRNPDRSAVTPWTGIGNLYVYSTGACNGVTRTVRVAASGYAPNGNWAIFTLDRVSFWNGSAINVTGDVQTDNVLDFSGHPAVHGVVYFNGPAAGWYGGVDPGSYTVVRRSQKVLFPTVDQLAAQRWPAGGLTYLATHNSNASAIPPIAGNSITASTTLVGPGDYYVENISLSGQSSITLDNRNGAIRMWVGPSGGSGTCQMHGGSAMIKSSTDASKTCIIYVATTSGITLAGNEELDAAVYAYNKGSCGNEYGYIVNSGTPTIYGQLLANEIDLNGNCTITAVPNLINPSSMAYYGCVPPWLEIGGAN